ncbi:MAG: glycosyltransferase [Veillonella parvula]
MRNLPKLCIVIPCYNEEEVLPITAPLFLKKILSLINLEKISTNSKILFIDDGSKDETWNLINEMAHQNKYYIGIRQSRNRGHQNAVLAGLMEAKENFDITIH